MKSVGQPIDQGIEQSRGRIRHARRNLFRDRPSVVARPSSSAHDSCSTETNEAVGSGCLQHMFEIRVEQVDRARVTQGIVAACEPRSRAPVVQAVAKFGCWTSPPV